MIEPTLALQTAIRSVLLDSPNLLALVDADHITADSTRPEKTPCIILANGTTSLHGHDYKAQRAAWVYLDLHVWTLDQGEQAAKEISGQIMKALDNPILEIDDGTCDHFELTSTRFMRDPDPAYGHGILSVEALIRWYL